MDTAVSWSDVPDGAGSSSSSSQVEPATPQVGRGAAAASPADDAAARLLETAAVLGCLPYAHDGALEPSAAAPPRGPRALALFNPDSPLLATSVAASPSAPGVSQRTARRRARAVSSERLREVQLRADARTVTGLLSAEAPPALRALRHGVDPQAVADTVQRELDLGEAFGSPLEGEVAREQREARQAEQNAEHEEAEAATAEAVACKEEAEAHLAAAASTKEQEDVENARARLEAEMATGNDAAVHL